MWFDLIFVVPKHSSPFMKGALIAAMIALGLAVVLFVLLLVFMLSKKERAAKRYVVVKKQVQQETSEKKNKYSFFCY